ncbi:MAG: hypothetical protein ACYTXI_04420 [Nostoc sp.]
MVRWVFDQKANSGNMRYEQIKSRSVGEFKRLFGIKVAIFCFD